MFKNKINDLKIETIFLFFCLFFGFIFVFVTAPFMVADESSHFLKAWDVSQWNFIQKNPSITVPKSIGDSVGNVSLSSNDADDIMKIMSLGRNDYLQYFNEPLNAHETQKISIINIYTYPPMSYIAPAFVLKTGEFFNLSPLILLYLTRLINLITYAIIVYFGIKILPIGKYMFLLITLMPMTLSQAASASGDSLNNALSFFIICLFLKLALNKKQIQKNDIILLSLSLLGVALSKQIYILLGLLFFIIPKSNFSNIRIRLLYFLSIIIPPGIIVVFWNLLSKYYVSSSSKIVSSTFSNGSYLLDFSYIITNTLITRFNYIATSFVGYFGWLAKCYPLPLILIYIYLIVLVIVSVIEINDFKLLMKQKIISILIFFIGSLALLLIIFGWEPAGSMVIGGIQGRYFIPFAPLFFLTLQNNKLYNYFRDESNQIYLKIFVLIFIGICLIISSYILSFCLDHAHYGSI
ncbi:MAG: DUF2142 domain-containing protein [Methanobrevibacter sp.]|jgi:uncharacterized membrane protein|nr:DUF2142 domain-containing protein [Candidatus Methanovirga basalitermitum]